MGRDFFADEQNLNLMSAGELRKTSLANMMSELRKYGVGLTLAHQHLHQLERDIRHAVLGNAGTLISFRVGAEDAPLLARGVSGEIRGGRPA
jgi:type IV secretory pathway TraG/TraD family ATPase VirD4